MNGAKNDINFLPGICVYVYAADTTYTLLPGVNEYVFYLVLYLVLIVYVRIRIPTCTYPDIGTCTLLSRGNEYVNPRVKTCTFLVDQKRTREFKDPDHNVYISSRCPGAHNVYVY